MAFDENLMSYLEAFLEKTTEQLQALEERLVYLEKDLRDRDCLEEVFRLAHTLKGNAATLGFGGMAGLAHRMEDLLDALRRGAANVTPEVTDVLLACLDALKGLAEEAGRGGCTADLAVLTWRLERLARGAAGRKRRGMLPLPRRSWSKWSWPMTVPCGPPGPTSCCAAWRS
ncbi:MAG: Hpt domain-containing protein [Desulfotomaculales bacterium]